MKKNLPFVVALLFFTVLPVPAQIDSALGYYPLNIGDVWQYYYPYDAGRAADSHTAYSLVEVTGDTLMPNGKWYRIVKRTGPVSPSPFYPPRDFQRIDSSTANVYGYGGLHYVDGSYVPGEDVSDSLCANGGDRFGRYMICHGAMSMTVLGVTSTAKMFAIMSAFGPTYVLFNGLGMCRVTTQQEDPIYPIWRTLTAELVYAKINGKEYGVRTGMTTPHSDLPLTMRLEQNYPNPFNPTTAVRYQLPVISSVRLVVYNILGREVAVLVNERQEAGVHEVKFDGSGLSSGVYFYRLQAGDFVMTKRLLLMK